MKTSVITIFFALAIAGCASVGTNTGGPVKIGEDLYMIGGLGDFFDVSGSAVKARFFKQAAEHCAGIGREMMPVNSTSQDVANGKYASAEVQYRCTKK